MITKIFELEKTFSSWDEQFYPSLSQQFYDRMIPSMLALLNVKAHDLVLDAGCGVGVHSIRAVQYGCRVHAIDISSVALTEARRRAMASGTQDAIIFAQEDLTQIGLQDESFTAILSWGVIIHIPKVGRALDELIRLLKPGGRLALYVINSAAWDDRFRAVVRACLRKPSTRRSRSQIGSEAQYDVNGEQLWIWHFDIKALIEHMEDRGLYCISRIAGEFTQLHLHCQGRFRDAMLQVNNVWARLRLPVGPAAMNLLIFEKSQNNGTFEFPQHFGADKLFLASCVKYNPTNGFSQIDGIFFDKV